MAKIKKQTLPRKGVLVRLLLPDFKKLEILAEIERRALGPYVEGLILQHIKEKDDA